MSNFRKLIPSIFGELDILRFCIRKAQLAFSEGENQLVNSTYEFLIPKLSCSLHIQLRNLNYTPPSKTGLLKW